MDMVPHQAECVQFDGPVRISVKESEYQTSVKNLPGPFEGQETLAIMAPPN